MECSRIKKSQEPKIFVFLTFWKPITSYNFFMASTRMFRISFSIIKPIKKPLQTHNFFTLGTHKKQLLNLMGM